jgi:DNA methylase
MSLPGLLTDTAWPSEPASGRGRSHGTSSKEPFDRWFRYPAGFASDYVQLLLDRLELVDGAVVDCFAGSGVTGTAARARGHAFAGIEAHPLVAELARLKLVPVATANEVSALASEVATLANRSATRPTVRTDSEPDLILRSFNDETLQVLLGLRCLIKERLNNPASLYLKWALLATLRDVADVKVGWPYQRPGITRKPRYSDPIARFEARAQLMVNDLMTVADSHAPPQAAQIVLGDARDPGTWAQLTTPSDACIASPPYLNNFDYADATRLELYFWGEVATWRDMCREVRNDMLTATTQQSSVAEMKTAIASLKELPTGPSGPVKEILGLVESITEAKRQRGRRSKEYDQVTPAYFLAMWDILGNLHNHLASGGTVLWLVGDSAPYGVYVDTPRLIGELAAQMGFGFVEDVSLRVRGNRWGQNADRHKVPLAERLIVLTKQPGDTVAAPAAVSPQQLGRLVSPTDRLKP